MYFFVFFFFQAEDGIRDTSVTGVQTCALPIWREGSEAGWGRSARRARSSRAAGSGPRPWRRRGVGRPRGRSEERRVGKEGGATGAAEGVEGKSAEAEDGVQTGCPSIDSGRDRR